MDIQKLKNQLTQGERRAIAQAMTLVESGNPEHQIDAQELLSEILPHAGNSFRIGISGAPGVGKSTFIESFGQLLIQKGHRVAVLAVDPSSPLSKGSILADKTRMITLSQSPNAFIRPSPSGGVLGGTAQRTQDVITIAEAAGFNVILIETIGVGQSEIAISYLADMVLLLLAPALGDELQGIKKGIVEIADLILINKSDSGLETLCDQTAQAYRNALQLSHPRLTSWSPQVQTISAIEGKGLEDLYNLTQDFKSKIQASHEWHNARKSQARFWLEQDIKALFWKAVEKDFGLSVDEATIKIENHDATSYLAALKVLEKIFH